ncbi:hypothetical protein C4D60_Mb06t36350 [Musa balbisiana]|uniref:Glycylpeptide N-tetradecanoyltransferase n=1 Tax=Musa balbisiana TaxID=52838 RepID=A0A4S8IU07_MUSBA|nr:hypothetical protein C4D60_Mb06t36350 [Musa balbisiana]
MVLGDNDSSSPVEEQTANPDPQPVSDAPPAREAAAEGDGEVESLARRIQEALAVGSRHRFWETQPVGQFKDARDEATVTPGFRKMELRDVAAVTRLLRDYLSQFVVAPDFDENDVEHWLLPLENVVDSFVVESPETHEVTDFCSFYSLPSSILNNPNYSGLKAAYSYYNVAMRTPLLQLMNDALIVAKQKDYDVFNALDLMHNEVFLKELKFGPGDGQLHYYLYNYRLRSALQPSELGLVLL